MALSSVFVVSNSLRLRGFSQGAPRSEGLAALTSPTAVSVLLFQATMR